MYPTQLDLEPEQSLFSQTGRTFLEREYPISSVRALIATRDKDDTLDRDMWRREAELGWFGLLTSAEFGGGAIRATGVADSASVAAELGRALHPGPVLSTAVIARALARGGSAWHRTHLVPRLIGGELVASWALGDVGWLWGDCAPTVQIELGADGGAVISGSARYVPDAASADYLLVSGHATYLGVVEVTIPITAPGVRVMPLQSLDLTRGIADVVFEAVTQPADAVLHASGLARQFDLLALLHSVDTVGAADRVFEFTLRYAKDRIAFGRPIGSYQAIKHRLADLLVTLESGKATVAAAIRAAEADSPDTSHLVSVAAAYVGDTVPQLIQECVHIHGGIGLTWEHDIHLYLRRATTTSALFGTPAQHRRRLDALLTPTSGGASGPPGHESPHQDRSSSREVHLQGGLRAGPQ